MMRTERAARRRRSRPGRRARCGPGCATSASVPELWVPLVMMAIVGTLAFNFQVVFPLFVTRDLGGDDGTFTLLFSVVSVGSLVGALSTRAAQAASSPPRRARRRRLRHGDARAWRRSPERSRVGLPDRPRSWASAASRS